MKSRNKELLDRAIAATVAAIEIYNKPDFLYREEAFAVLAINGWELLLKAKWLDDHGNKISALYVKEFRKNKDGTNSKKLKIKRTRSGIRTPTVLTTSQRDLSRRKPLTQSLWTTSSS